MNNIIDQIRIKCPHCGQIFQLSDRFNHIKNCESTKVLGCPMNCTSATAKTFKTLKQHIVQECSNEILNCQGCGFELYKHYAGRMPINPRGHNCMRDNPQSPMLLHNLQYICRKVNSRELQGLEQELLVYKGPIPNRCVPEPDEPMGFFTVE